MVRAYIAFGANLGDPVAAFAEALQRLDALPDTRVVARSSLYRSTPVGVAGQPDYLNAVIALDTALAPRPLLEALLTIEHDAGRRRDFPMAPRTLDLDLLLHGDAVIDEAGLQVPHPRMHERAFALLPLAEIDPAASIPGRGAVAALLPALAGQAIERVPTTADTTRSR
ncbi:MAG: 2-amino-4-hydroxy-6-hydroxymethyldihydropteridine diphosphokinase [Thauera sp.]|nr:2-amino-4-hydroxy-6-hydroxymethyldihydropteridine diphosphokinase [Thauera sp.]